MSKVQNRERLLAKLAAIPKEVRVEMGKALKASADQIADQQRRLAPSRTGKLRKSIKVTQGGAAPAYSQGGRAAVEGDPDLTVVISAGNTDVRYAHLVEFGTAPHTNKGRFEGTQHPGATAAPFFYPVFRANRRRAAARATRAMKKGIKNST